MVEHCTARIGKPTDSHPWAFSSFVAFRVLARETPRACDRGTTGTTVRFTPTERGCAVIRADDAAVARAGAVHARGRRQRVREQPGVHLVLEHLPRRR